MKEANEGRFHWSPVSAEFEQDGLEVLKSLERGRNKGREGLYMGGGGNSCGGNL